MADEDEKPEEDDFARFMKGGDEEPGLPEGVESIGGEAKTAEDKKKAAAAPLPSSSDTFSQKTAAFKPSAPPPGFRGDKAVSEENLDPVLQQQAKERKAEEERKARLAEKGVPEHMMDHVVEDATANLVKKGETIDLMQKAPGLRKLYIGAGWTARSLDESIDVDLSVFLLNRNDVTSQDSDFIFYNQMTAYDGAIKHEGDNRTGAGEGDEEGIFIDLNGVPFEIVKIMIVLSVYDELEVGYHLGQVRSSYVRLTNREYNEEICRFALGDDLKDNTAVYAAALVREGPRWLFEPIGNAIGRGGLPNVASRYGIIVKELQSSG